MILIGFGDECAGGVRVCVFAMIGAENGFL